MYAPKCYKKKKVKVVEKKFFLSLTFFFSSHIAFKIEKKRFYMWTFSTSPSRFSLTKHTKKYSFNTERKKNNFFLPHLLAVGFSFPLIQPNSHRVSHKQNAKSGHTISYSKRRRRRWWWWERFFSTLPDVEELIIATYRENIIELLSLTRREFFFCRPFFTYKKNYFILFSITS